MCLSTTISDLIGAVQLKGSDVPLNRRKNVNFVNIKFLMVRTHALDLWLLLLLLSLSCFVYFSKNLGRLRAMGNKKKY